MAAKTVLNYIPKKSIVHELTGTTKLILFLLFSIVSMITFDIRVLAALFIFSIITFKVSKIKYKEVAFMFNFTIIFTLINFIVLYLFNPNYGPNLYGSRTVLLHIAGRYDITIEQLFYQLHVSSKYLIGLPLAIMFVSTTNPSELASSLNAIGMPYKVSYAFSLALRYIPDIQKDYHDISLSQQARGVMLGKDVKLWTRFKNAITIVLPLILVSIARIDTISNAMDLRCFGKNKKRTWYMRKKFSKKDYVVLTTCIIFAILCLVVTFSNGSRFYNPFK